MQALQWLKQHNPLYRDVPISNISEGMFVDGEEVTEGENGRQEENLKWMKLELSGWMLFSLM